MIERGGKSAPSGTTRNALCDRAAKASAPPRSMIWRTSADPREFYPLGKDPAIELRNAGWDVTAIPDGQTVVFLACKARKRKR